jgi:hypothetical protein
MNGAEPNRSIAHRKRSVVIELSMDEYNLDDLAGEIARTLEACQALSGDHPDPQDPSAGPQAR